MTDNRTTELREKLTERGVEYQALGKRLTYWNRDGSSNDYDDADFVADEQNGSLTVEGLTPDQAIAATLGAEPSADATDALELLDEIRSGDRICYDDYSRLFDAIATLGSGTCEPNWVLQDKTQTQEFWRCECGNCGESFGVESRESFPFKMTIDKVDVPNFCPNCGKAVKR